MSDELIRKIKEKKEYSKIPDKLIKKILNTINSSDEKEKVKLVRSLLRKRFTAFMNNKLIKEKDLSLRFHSSTRERIAHYDELYEELVLILRELDIKEFSLIDLGCGINGLSYEFLRKKGLNPFYLGIEIVGQIVELMNSYFKKEGINGKVLQIDLLNKEEVLKAIQKTKEPRIIFLFKVIDALEEFRRNYSKELLLALKEMSELIVISYSIRSMSGKRFIVNRNWLKSFINENFEIVKTLKTFNEEYLFLRPITPV